VAEKVALYLNLGMRLAQLNEYDNEICNAPANVEYLMRIVGIPKQPNDDKLCGSQCTLISFDKMRGRRHAACSMQHATRDGTRQLRLSLAQLSVFKWPKEKRKNGKKGG